MGDPTHLSDDLQLPLPPLRPLMISTYCPIYTHTHPTGVISSLKASKVLQVKNYVLLYLPNCLAYNTDKSPIMFIELKHGYPALKFCKGP